MNNPDTTFPATGTHVESIAQSAAARSLAPPWEIYQQMMSHEPAPRCSPAHLPYREVRPLLARAGREISTAEAERRVLLFKNPGLDRPITTLTLGCGLQLLLGGEQEGAHRHTPAALRFVLEGDGTYTTTDGERLWMAPGDLITTQSWTWHDHGKVTEGEMIWMNGIDVPLVNHLGLNFTEYAEGERRQEPNVADGESQWLYGSGFAPLAPVPTRPSTPIPTHMRARRSRGCWPPADRIRATASRCATRTPRPAAISCRRSRPSCSFFQPDSRHIRTSRPMPNWTSYRLVADDELGLFGYSDRALQERLGLFHEDRGGFDV